MDRFSRSVSRRSVITTAAAVALAGRASGALAAPGSARSQLSRAGQDYSGKFVILSAQEAEQAQLTIDAIKA
ncbi:MAG: hypothetical protein ACRDHN_14440, partial [Thermomicrobiales bacterium]